ncbi:MAG: hypothetical protein H8D45_26235 [Bacteroidetes bacterium]|nr:hypothetical protein [Bacteroidota bacterium]
MTKRFFKYHLLLISILFFITRLLFLDRDLPPWDLTFYSGLDEMTYNIPAFNQYHYGTISYQVVEFLPADTDLHYSLLGNFMTYISLELFGNNYFGLRIAPIIASSIIIGLLLYFLYKMIDKNNATRLTKKFNLFCYIIISFYIIFNFSFLIASRVNEPTIFRTMTMIVIIYFALKMFPEDHDLKLTHVYFLGLLSCFGVLFVYLHNLFMVPAFGFFIIYLGYKKGIKEAITCGFIFLFGILCALEVFLFVFELVNDKTYWEMFLYLKNSPGWERRIGYLTTSSIFQVIKSIIRNGYLFWGTNIFRLDLSLLFLFLISLPIYLHKIVREKNTWIF